MTTGPNAPRLWLFQFDEQTLMIIRKALGSQPFDMVNAVMIDMQRQLDAQQGPAQQGPQADAPMNGSGQKDAAPNAPPQ